MARATEAPSWEEPMLGNELGASPSGRPLLPRPAFAPTSGVTVDATDEHDPTSKLGVVVRGPATAHPTRRTMEVRVEPERVTWRQGTETETQVVA